MATDAPERQCIRTVQGCLSFIERERDREQKRVERGELFRSDLYVDVRVSVDRPERHVGIVSCAGSAAPRGASESAASGSTRAGNEAASTSASAYGRRVRYSTAATSRRRLPPIQSARRARSALSITSAYML